MNADDDKVTAVNPIPETEHVRAYWAVEVEPNQWCVMARFSDPLSGPYLRPTKTRPGLLYNNLTYRGVAVARADRANRVQRQLNHGEQTPFNAFWEDLQMLLVDLAEAHDNANRTPEAAAVRDLMLAVEAHAQAYGLRGDSLFHDVATNQDGGAK